MRNIPLNMAMVGDCEMEYVKLGRTGLEVSRICLGCMSYGVADRGNHAWSID